MADVKSDVDKTSINETSKLNVHETSALTSEEEEEEEEESNGVVPKRREGEKMKDPPVKERSEPLLTAGGTAVTDNTKQTNESLKGTHTHTYIHVCSMISIMYVMIM